MIEKFRFEGSPKTASDHNAELLTDGGFLYEEQAKREEFERRIKEKEMEIAHLRKEKEVLLEEVKKREGSTDSEHLLLLEAEIKKLEEEVRTLRAQLLQ